jgi:diaminohydroxyphosphoribosylaminopyrimidine deaminase / 5-amino-6-(5-phosphoribosylamino)uracil reductase
VSRDARVFHDGEAPTLWLCDARCSVRAESFVGAEQVLGVEGLIDNDGGLDAAVAVAALRSRGLRVLFVEGGGKTVSRFLQQGCLDRLHLAVAPVLIGAGRAGLQLPDFGTLSRCPRPAFSVLQMGDDVLWDMDLRSAQAAFAHGAS